MALGRADLIVVAGARLDFRLNFGQPPLFAADARIVTIDSGDAGRSRGLVLAGDVRAALGGLADAVSGGAAHREWVEQVTAAGRSAVPTERVR